MNRDEVLAEMKRSVGSQFDPELAELFFALDFSAWEQLMITHQANRSNLGSDPMENGPITGSRKAA
jgi:response regulator RpfG family c-di-GMP phosphodiesterase